MVDWIYTLRVKEYLSDNGESDHVIEISKKFSVAIRKLMETVSNEKRSKVLDRVGDLYIELDEAADLFDDVTKWTVEAFPFCTALAQFNDALEVLYDVADTDHRIWVK